MRRAILLLFASLAGIIVVHAQPRDITIEASVSNPSPYTGEIFTYTVRILIADNAEITSWNYVPPRFTSLGQIALDPPPAEKQIIEGRQFTVGTQDTILSSMTAGSVQIEPARIVLDDGRIIESQAIDVIIQPLPSGQPANFSGAVGQYEISLQTSDTLIETGSVLEITLEVRGSRAINRIQAPEISFPDSWTTILEEIPNRSDTGTIESKFFVWKITPRQAGLFSIEPVTLTYFDPDISSYHEVTSDAITIEVINQGLQSRSLTGRNPDNSLFAREIPRLEASSIGSPITTLLVWLLPPVLVLGLTIYTSKLTIRSVRPTPPSGDRWTRSALKRLSELESGQPTVAYESVANILQEAIVQGKTHPALERLLQEANAARYAPVTSEDAEMLIRHARQVLSKIQASPERQK